MAVQISESFQLYTHAPLDSRSQFRTVAEMRSFPASRLYEGIIASVVENNTTYQFFSSNEATEKTGKWRIFGVNSSPEQKHDSDVVHLVMNIENADIQPGNNYLYIGSEPYSATGKNLLQGDIFTVNTDGSFTVLFHVGSGSGESSEPSEPSEPTEPVIPETIADPVITITEGGDVTIACDTEDVTIYYTTDGTDPSTTSIIYDNVFFLTEDTTVKAIAIKGDNTSSIVTKVYKAPVQTIVTEPKIVITENGEVTLTCDTENAIIHYTLDGTDPSSLSQVYSGVFAVTNGTTVKAVAIKDNIQSSIISKTYIVTIAKDYAYYGILSSTLDTTVHVTDEGLVINEATVSALTKKDITSNAGTFAFVASQANRDAPGFSFKVYAYPAKFGELKEYNFGFGVNSISPEFTRFDIEINGEAYYVYAQETGFRPTKVGATYTYTFD